MRRVSVLIPLLLSLPCLAFAQSQTRERTSNSQAPASTAGSTAVRTRVVGPRVVAANHVEKRDAIVSPRDQSESTPVSTPDRQTANDSAQNAPLWGNTTVELRGPAEERTPTLGKATTGDQEKPSAKKLVQQTVMFTASQPVALPTPALKANISSISLAPTNIYRVGVGDVLDIRISNLPTRESTLFTISRNGTLEYPLFNGSLAVSGLTTDEIAALITREIKVIQGPRVSVSVRDYASHAVIVTGLVDNPGRRILRREAMPLYALLAEALTRPEASAASIVRAGKEQTVSLHNREEMSTLVLSGDMIRVLGPAAKQPRFIYVGGDVVTPGEREFRDGMTLTQALMAAGGVSRAGKISVKISRQNAAGFLTASEYSLQTIQAGKSQDPLLEAGDRVEVTRVL